MDKYETGLRIQEIRNAYEDKNFIKAAELAKDVDWSKIKEWIPLAMMVDVQEQVGDLEEARDMAILAYNRNLGGRKLLYRLTEIFIKLGDFEHAEELFNEYSKVARHNSSRYILEYHLLRAKKAPNAEQIKVLEKFRDKEIDEHYMYKLAGLYAKNGEEDKAIKICDEISLWFLGGDYVEGAVKLKKRLGGKLNAAQEKVYEAAKVREEDLEKTREMTFAEQLKLARMEVGSANDKEESKLGDGLLDSAKSNADKDDMDQFVEVLKAQGGQDEGFDAEKEYGSEAVFDLTPKKKSGSFFSALFKGMRNRNEDKVTDEDLKDEDLYDSSYFKDDDQKIQEIVEEKVTKSNIDITDEEPAVNEEPAAGEESAVSEEYVPEFENDNYRKFINNDLEDEKEEPDVFGDDDDTEDEDEAEEFAFEEKKEPADELHTDALVAEMAIKAALNESDAAPVSTADAIADTLADTTEAEDKQDEVEAVAETEVNAETVAEAEESAETTAETEANSEVAAETETVDEAESSEDAPAEETADKDENTSGFSDSLKSVIDGAKEHLHKGYSDMISTESLVSVPEIHERLGIREELSADVSKIMSEEAASPVVGNAVPEEEEQIEGQMNLTEWIEAERERKYADRNTKEFSISELERALDEIEDKSKAYDKLMEEQKRLAREAGEPFNESVAKRNVEFALSVRSARTDLDIRTGKAQAMNEVDVQEKFFAQPEAELDDTRSTNEIIAEIVKMGIDAPEDKLKVFAIAFADINPESVNIQIDKAPKKVVSAANVLYDYFMGKEITDEPVEEQKISAEGVTPDVADPAAAVAIPSIANVIASEAPEAEKENVEETTPEEEVTASSAEDTQEEVVDTTAAEPETVAEENPVDSNPIEDDDNYEYSSVSSDVLNDSAFKAFDADEIKDSVSPKLMPGDTVELPVAETFAAISEPETNEESKIDPEIIPPVSDFIPGYKEPGYLEPEEDEVEQPQVHVTIPETENAHVEDVQEATPVQTEDVQQAEDVELEAEVQPEADDVQQSEQAAPEQHDEMTPPNGRIGETVVIPREAIAEAMRNSADNAGSDVPYQNVVITDATRNKVMDLFDAYVDLPGVTEELHELINDLPKELAKKDSSSGNIIITGNNMSDKTAFAKLIARAIDMIDPNTRRKVVKTTGDTLNKYGFASSADKLRGKILIIEDAASILPAVAEELLQSLKQDTDRLFVILEDSDAEMEVLLKFNPLMEYTFNHRIILRQYSVNELVDIFREIAKRDGYTVSDDGLLVLYLSLDKLRSKNNNVSMDEINDLVDRAIAHNKKRTSKGGGLFGRKKKIADNKELTDEDIKI